MQGIPVMEVRGARVHNLKNINCEIPHYKLTVVTGVSGSGKSSLAFDTVYAEGQRRYVESLSAYARQFLERMDKPQVDRIEGIPPAIAIDQTNPVRTSRSTVGTMTELTERPIPPRAEVPAQVAIEPPLKPHGPATDLIAKLGLYRGYTAAEDRKDLTPR